MSINYCLGGNGKTSFCSRQIRDRNSVFITVAPKDDKTIGLLDEEKSTVCLHNLVRHLHDRPFLAAKAIELIEEATARSFIVVVDEFQMFCTPEFVEYLLALATSEIWIIHQFPEQIPKQQFKQLLSQSNVLFFREESFFEPQVPYKNEIRDQVIT